MPDSAAAEPQWLGQALRRRRFLLTPWPWRAGLHLLSAAALLTVLGAPVMLAFAPLLTQLDLAPRGSVLWGAVASAPLVAATLVLLAPWTARISLTRLRLVDRRPVPRLEEPSGFARRWRYRLTDRTAWLRVVYLAVLSTLGPVALMVVAVVAGLAFGMLLAPVLVAVTPYPVTVGPWEVSTFGPATLLALLGVPTTAGACYLVAGLSAVEAQLTRLLLLEPGARYEAELVELARSRARLVAGFDAERRRIERDLHDVAQQRVTALTMQLALVELDATRHLGADHPVSRDIAAAHIHATALMSQLRALIHGIHPKVLTDVGVGAALDQLAADLPLPVRIDDSLSPRPPAHVESTLYFCASEALTNAVRHSGAAQICVTLRRVDGGVQAAVLDDGHGGADVSRGTGLAGIADRVAVLAGTVHLSSPAGGPTLLRITVPEARLTTATPSSTDTPPPTTQERP